MYKYRGCRVKQEGRPEQNRTVKSSTTLMLVGYSIVCGVSETIDTEWGQFTLTVNLVTENIWDTRQTKTPYEL